MTPIIDREKTGKQIRRIMELRGLSVHDVQRFLSLGCVQSVYHWFDGKSMPTIDNLYALSELLQVPMDMLVVGDRSYHPIKEAGTRPCRLLSYYRMMQEYMAA